MSGQETYTPGPARGARVEKEGEKWTLVLERELRHAPEKVWKALTETEHLKEWAPFEIEGSLGAPGTVKLTWTGTTYPIETKVMRVDAPRLLEYGDMKWVLEGTRGGTRLTLWHSIDRRYISMGAAGWHIALDVLDRQLAGDPISRIVGAEAMQLAGWQKLNEEYAEQFGVKAPKWPAGGGKS